MWSNKQKRRQLPVYFCVALLFLFILKLILLIICIVCSKNTENVFGKSQIKQLYIIMQNTSRAPGSSLRLVVFVDE